MNTTVWLLAILIYLWNYVESVPPEACFANFRWDDCGYPPQAVLYYYKSGSRCEVGFWRGCYPNPNMFKDEYECVNTCIFTVRAQPPDYHNLNDVEPLDHEIDVLIPGTNSTEDESTTPADDNVEGSGSGNDSSGDGQAATEDGVTASDTPEISNNTDDSMISNNTDGSTITTNDDNSTTTTPPPPAPEK